MEKVAQTGAVTLKHAGRSMLVESREDGQVEIAAPHGEPRRTASSSQATTAHRRAVENGSRRHDDGGQSCRPGGGRRRPLPQSPMTMQDGIRAVQQAFAQARPQPRWPMYVRQAKQFLKARIEASTSGSTASRRSSICCARPRRKACSGSNAIVRARSASLRDRS